MNTHTQQRRVRADSLRPGDLVDLGADPFADPGATHPGLQCEFVTVTHTRRETPGCIAVGFEGFDVVGFPPDHLVVVQQGITAR